MSFLHFSSFRLKLPVGMDFFDKLANKRAGKITNQCKDFLLRWILFLLRKIGKILRDLVSEASFFKKLVKLFAIPFLLFLSMGFFTDDISSMMVIACLIVLYFLIIALILIIRFINFSIHIKKVKVFKEEKTIVIQMLQDESRKSK